jgi:FkbM family methyltransferase
VLFARYEFPLRKEIKDKISAMLKKLRKTASWIKSKIHSATKANSGPVPYVVAEKERLAKMPRYEATKTMLAGTEMHIPDGLSFVEAWKEIWEKEIYSFETDSKSPLILDCGANVGLATLYFKKKFPQAEIFSFEPDPVIHSYLVENLSSAGLKDVKVYRKAIWTKATELRFLSEGSDSGKIINEGEGVIVESVDLKDFLNQPVQFLKMDIEGAECDVLFDAKPLLGNVEKIFVEYHSFVNSPQMLGELLNLLKESGFRYHMQSVMPHDRPFLLNAPYRNTDLLTNIFAFRR